MDDKNLKPADIQTLASNDGVASLFATLGYDTDMRLPQTAAAMGITAESLQRQIKNIEQLAVQEDGAEPLYVYLVELTSVTVAATQGMVRALRNRVGNYLLVLTDDYARLDFVLLERTLPKSNGSAFSTRQVSVRPRILTVNRRNPSQVHLRVLRRFTYTEADSDAQYDKLLSAYTVAEWSEPLFNNRALFSDYYLNQRLPDLDEWQERPETTYHRFRELLTDVRERLSGHDEATTRQTLLEPAFEALGFRAVVGNSGPESGEPDYRLYAPDAPDKPIALCLGYTWNRYLDGRDETRDTDSPDENPGARVVTALDSGEAPWVIVTNGKIWRLYSARTHSRSTNYYEIDLEETLAMADPNVAFRYFWLLFRAAAFVPKEVVRDGQSRQMCFLDELVEESESYAKRLGERLKERVFEQIFPHFAEGFSEYLKGEPDEEFQRQVFQGTLTLLYRLLFLLYAESRGLLPAKEERGYFEHSLTKLKEEIAKEAGDIYDEAPQKLGRAYRARADATDLYDRLLKLFGAIDKGSRELNVPLYNGGLFLTKPSPDDTSLEAETARFLQENKIPDRYLAMGLDLLARDVDDKRQDLVFIDYKSLGVRQLGSIYEGLLEFKIRIAPEKMAVVKGKRTEEVIPYKEAVKSKKKVLTRGRGRNAEERVYKTGDVYLENDRQERKATGSYYTPDHIVKYIVENTVGPVLEEKFEKLRPKFREAGQKYRDAQRRDETLRKQGIESNEAAKVPRGERSQRLVDELFDLRVLDPAMGSGHFLVEAVDFVCDRILGEREGFLRAFPWNPVTAFLDDTRQAIIVEMERQGVSVDTGRLNDINLLKRHVLKRCVYGVDLNPMAVELAKVSLWLDCFTIGAPLSFLDHHLKCGNSLIGTTVEEAEAEGRTKENQTFQMFGGPFQGILSGTRTMLQIARTPDVTVSESEKSRAMFADFEKDMRKYKTLLDIGVSRFFGNMGAQSLLDFKDASLVNHLENEGRDLPPDQRTVVEKAMELSSAKRFFHWDLEFPEAFVDLNGGSWKPKNEQGFDAVVGNPPYVRQEGLGEDKSYFQIAHAPVYSGVADLYVYFYHRGLTLLCNQGLFGMITSNKFLRAGYGKPLRVFLAEHPISDIIDFRDLPVFQDATSYPLILVSRRNGVSDGHLIRTYAAENMADVARIAEIMNHQLPSLSESALRPDGWTLQRQEVLELLDKIRSAGEPLGEVINGRLYFGIKTGYNQAFIIDESKRAELVAADPKSAEIIKPFLRGRDIKRWRVEWAGMYLIKAEIGVDFSRYPAVFEHLKQYQQALERRWDKGNHWWELRTCDYYAEFDKPKIVYPDIYEHQSFAYDLSGALVTNTSYFIPTEERWLVALLNSSLIEFYYRNISAQVRGGYLRAFSSYISQIPIRWPSDSDRRDLNEYVELIMTVASDQASVKECEQATNHLVYHLYGLSDYEIAIVEEKA